MISRRRWKKVSEAINGFREFLSQSFPEFIILEALDSQWSDSEYEKNKPVGFPNDLRGVYLLYTDNEELGYVGLAMKSFMTRVSKHDAKFEQSRRRYIDIITVKNKEFEFIMPALEYFLISHLMPKHNKVYQGYEGELIEFSDGVSRPVEWCIRPY